MYEALVGLVLLEQGGDVHSAWQVFRSDFFPPSTAEEEAEQRTRLAEALRDERKRIAQREAERTLSLEQRRAERLQSFAAIAT